jgi:hypothetical protein
VMNRRFLLVATAICLTTVTLTADTLVLTNGRRVQGTLMGVSGRDIEFEERAPFSRRALRIPRSDVARIEFDDQDLSAERDDRDRDRRDEGPRLPRGLRERMVNVTAREPWTDTGVDVRASQQVYFRAAGETHWKAKHSDGAAGERNSPRNALRPMPDRPAAALIGRIGENGDAFFIGDDQAPYRVRGTGRLYLGTNDDYLPDNSGALQVTISY